MRSCLDGLSFVYLSVRGPVRWEEAKIHVFCEPGKVHMSLNLIQFHCRVKMRPFFSSYGKTPYQRVFSGEGGLTWLRLVFRRWVVYEPIENSLHLLVLTIKIRKWRKVLYHWPKFFWVFKGSSNAEWYVDKTWRYFQ